MAEGRLQELRHPEGVRPATQHRRHAQWLTAVRHDGDKLSARELRDSGLTVLTDGSHTTSSLLTWALHLPGQHPYIARRVQEESDEILAGRTATWDDMARLPYMNRVVMESLRRITTKEADPLLPQRLANPSLSVFSAAAYGKGGKIDPTGHATGAFTLKKVNGAVSATLDRNARYWGGEAKAPGVDVRFVSDGTARANALRTQAADIAEYVPVSQAGLLDKDQVHEVPTARTSGLSLNTRRGAFADPAVRAAARSAIDSGALVDGVYEGRADTARGLLGPGVTWAAGDRREPEGRTKAASPAAVRAKGTVTLATYTNRPELPEAASAVQQQLEKEGFRVKQVVRDYAQMEADALAGKYDAFLQARNTLLDTGDPVTYLGSDFTCDGSFNISQLCDRKVDAAVAKAAGTADTDARHRAEADAEARILGTDALVPLVHERFVQGYTAGRVKGVALDPTERGLVTAATHLG